MEVAPTKRAPPTRTRIRRRISVGLLSVLGVLILAAILIPPSAGFRFCLGNTHAILTGQGMTLEDFARAVRAHGSTITLIKNPDGSGEWRLSGQAYRGTIDGQPMSVYDYRTPLGSYMETRCFVDANAIHPGLFGVEYIDTFQPTYWYRKGNLIVAYVGRDQHIPQLLQSIMGSTFIQTP